jgi:hypothetical protein
MTLAANALRLMADAMTLPLASPESGLTDDGRGNGSRGPQQ